MAQQKRQFLRRDGLPAKILLQLDRSFDWWMLSATQQPLIMKFGYEGTRNILDAKARAEYRRAVRRLEEMRILKMQKTSHAYEAKLTLRGAEELFRLKVLEASELPEGWLCLVIFDIPERHRALRDRLRRFLKHAGFTCLHRSVWYVKKDVFDPLMMLFALKGMDRDWIQVFKCEQKT